MAKSTHVRQPHKHCADSCALTASLTQVSYIHVSLTGRNTIGCVPSQQTLALSDSCLQHIGCTVIDQQVCCPAVCSCSPIPESSKRAPVLCNYCAFGEAFDFGGQQRGEDGGRAVSDLLRRVKPLVKQMVKQMVKQLAKQRVKQALQL